MVWEKGSPVRRTTRGKWVLLGKGEENSGAASGSVWPEPRESVGDEDPSPVKAEQQCPVVSSLARQEGPEQCVALGQMSDQGRVGRGRQEECPGLPCPLTCCLSCPGKLNDPGLQLFHLQNGDSVASSP